MNKVLGKIGQSQPRECAATGQPVQGRHSIMHFLRDGWYFRVLSKVSLSGKELETLREEVAGMIPRATTKSSAKATQPEKKETE